MACSFFCLCLGVGDFSLLLLLLGCSFLQGVFHKWMMCLSFMKISQISAIKLHIISPSTAAWTYVTPTSVGTSLDRGAVLGYTIKETFLWLICVSIISQYIPGIDNLKILQVILMFILHLSWELSVEAACRKQTSRRNNLCLALSFYSDWGFCVFTQLQGECQSRDSVLV